MSKIKKKLKKLFIAFSSEKHHALKYQTHKSFSVFLSKFDLMC
jgi:hypothetical protein